MLRLLARERNLVGADVMEVNPLLDCDNITSLAAATALAALLDGMAARLPARQRVFGEERMPHLQGETST